MKNQLLEMLASPSVEKLLALLQNLAQAPQESPLVAAVTGLVAGLLCTLLLGSWRGRRKRRHLNQSWQKKLDDLSSSQNSALAELQVSKDTQSRQADVLNEKLGSLDKTLAKDRAELHKARASVKTLTEIVSVKDRKIQKTIDDAAHRISQLQARQKKLNFVLERRSSELDELKAKTARADNMSALPLSETLMASIRERDDDYAEQLARRIDTLDVQRAQLLRERDELAAREAHYSEQLTDGDDTRFYLDETLALGTGPSAIADPSPAGHYLDNTAANTGALTQATDGFESTETVAPDTEPERSAATRATKTLWDRVRTSVSKSADKALTDKSDA